MTGPAPVSGDDSTRTRLAEVLQGSKVNLIQRGPLMFIDVAGPLTARDAYDLAVALLPVVESIAAERAAEALEEAASDWAADPDAVGDSYADARNWLRDRAETGRSACETCGVGRHDRCEGVSVCVCADDHPDGLPR